MYEAHYGLREKPFSLIPDPAFLFLSRSHKLALNLLEYGLSDQTGFIVITGEVGSGKTTLIRRLLGTAAADLLVGMITNTHASLGELMTSVLRAFDLKTAGMDKIDQYYAFIDFAIARYAEGKRCVLIIDEAQNLTPPILEEMRMLSNVNADKDFVLQLILVGQPELKETLRRTDLRQFAQRISVFHDLAPLVLKDTIGYIQHRLTIAGGSPDIIDVGACAAIHHYAFGTPRLINILADLALVIGFAEDRHTIDVDLVFEALDAQQSSGLEILRKDPEDMSREERKREILREVSKNWPLLKDVSKAAG
ncbi:MAG: AAA family ATPase [Rhodospirillales bacterium]